MNSHLGLNGGACSESAPTAAAVVHAPHVAWRTVGEEVVVVNLRTNLMVALNASGGRLWQALEAPRRQEDLAAAFSLSPFAVAAFVEELRALGMLAEAPAPGGVPLSPPQDLVNGELPQLLWSERLQTLVAASCAQVPGQSDICNQVPQG